MIKPAWRIVFFGTPSFAIPALKELIEGEDEVVAIVTQPDRPRGRGQKVKSSEVKEFIKEKMGDRLIIFQPEDVRERSFEDDLRDINPDLFVVVAYGQILPKPILKIPKYGAVNLHASLLPKYRGASPIAWAIINGEKVTGVTTILMDEGMDTGDILLQKEVEIMDEDTSETLSCRLAEIGSQLLKETIKRLKDGSIRPTPQDHTKASYAPMLKKEDGRIDWQKGAEEINRKVRAFTPWPGAFTYFNGKILKIYKGSFRKGSNFEKPGSIVWVGSDFIEVQTGDGTFLIKELQLEGKRRMNVRDFLLGHPVSIGLVFE